jgi:DNA invertase Pin-like site-specific DNA recombinase
VIYIRQSSSFQVQHNTGSTARQYNLYDLALHWGWAPERIIVVDNDLGVSGSKSGVRLGFAQMLQMVTMGQVSAVFTVHADRLARNLLESV